MKKSVFYSGAILGVALAVAGCNKEIDNTNIVEGGFPFEVSASTVETKTVNDGLSTKWAANDGINLFNAVAGTQTYQDNNEFKISDVDLSQNKFKGNLAAPLEQGTSYDWYAFYPYSSYIKTPANTNSGYSVLGHKHNMSEMQNENNSKAHLIGDVCPLYGKALSVSSDETPSLAMHHLASVVEVKVTNKNDAPLTVSKVTMTGTEDIVGTYYINIVEEPVVYTNSGASYVSDKVVLDVQNGTAIAKGETATFYLSFKPFTAKSGSVLKLSVNGYEKTLELNKDVTFSAGKIKTLNFNFDQQPVIFVAEADMVKKAATEGEVITIPYEIKNVVGSASVDAVSDQAWVKPDMTTPGQLKLTIDPSSETGTRTANITLSYKGAQDVIITVEQFGSTSIDYSIVYTSNVVLNQADGKDVFKSSVKIGAESFDAMKFGTSSRRGNLQIKVPAGTTKLHLFAAGWNKKNAEIKLTGAGIEEVAKPLTSDAGVANNTPFTLSGDPLTYYITYNVIADTEQIITIDILKDRALIWGVNAE